MLARRGQWSRAQMAVVAGVVVVVVVLFGFMALSSGPGDPSEEVAADASTTAASTTVTSTATSEAGDVTSPTAAPMPEAVTTTEPPDLDDDDLGDGIEDDGEDLAAGEDNPAFPLDAQRFCSGAAGITQLEGTLAGAFAAQDLEGVRRAVADHSEGWTAAVADIVEAGPPRNQVDFERYRDVYVWLLGIVETDGDLERIGNGYPPEYRDRSTNPDNAIDVAVREHCG